MGVCSDTNYKIRTDGAIFFKEYFRDNYQTLVGTSRMENTYIPELCELINDEETFIKIESLEAFQYILETLSCELIEKEIVPSFLKLLNTENQHDEVMDRMSAIIGPVASKLHQKEDLHLKYQQQILDFYRVASQHKSDECRQNAAYNLPCMNLIYRAHLDKVQWSPLLASQPATKIPVVSMTSSSSASLQVMEESKDEQATARESPTSSQGNTFDFDKCYLAFTGDANDQIR